MIAPAHCTRKFCWEQISYKSLWIYLYLAYCMLHKVHQISSCIYFYLSFSINKLDRTYTLHKRVLLRADIIQVLKELPIFSLLQVTLKSIKYFSCIYFYLRFTINKLDRTCTLHKRVLLRDDILQVLMELPIFSIIKFQ